MSDIAAGNSNSGHVNGAMAPAPHQPSTGLTGTNVPRASPGDANGGCSSEIVDLDPSQECEGTFRLQFEIGLRVLVLSPRFLGTHVDGSVAELKKIVDLLERWEMNQKATREQ